jgi:hypothetical protein
MPSERDKASENPYETPCTAGIVESTNHARWPARLTVAMVLTPVYVHLSLGAIRRSTGGHDHIEAMEKSFFIIPFLVLIPALALSTLRRPSSPILAKWAAIALLTMFASFTAWIWLNFP